MPIVIVGLLAGFFLIPTSKDPSAPKLDPVGALLSIVGLSTLLYGIIEAPVDGWGDSTIVTAFVGRRRSCCSSSSCGRAASTTRCSTCTSSRTRASPPRAAAITLMFFAMFGAIFLLTQYFQFVLGYSPLETGVRLPAVGRADDDRARR